MAAAPFVLASNSPRRHALLREAGYEFEVVVPAVSELVLAHLSLRELTTANATRKAIAVARIYPDRIVLAADTLMKMGYRNVSSMDGGWKRWKELGYPTEQ